MVYRPLETSEVDHLGDLVATSFNFPPDMARRWIEVSGTCNWRVLEEAGRLLGGLMLIPMGQWFQGKRVSMTGLAGVVVDARARGRGVGQKLISQALSDMRESGAAVSALYASTNSFYRRTGYETAGANYELEVNLKELSARSGSLEIRTLTEQQTAEVEALQRGWMTDHASLDRGPYVWHRVRNPRGVQTEQFGFYSEDKLEGYVFWKRSAFKGQESELEISDLVLTTPAAHRTFWSFLAGHRALFGKARWLTFSSSPWVLAMSDPWNFKLSLHSHWMLRLVELKKALESRGYAPGSRGQIHFEVEDSIVSENSGRWVLNLSEKTIQKGGEGAVKLDIGAFGSLYSGFLSATQLAASGRLTGPTEQIKKADRAFAGEPRLRDFF